MSLRRIAQITGVALVVAWVGWAGAPAVHAGERRPTLQAMSSQELAGVRAAAIVREDKWCNYQGWDPCNGSNGCYWNPVAQQCRADAAWYVPACRPTTEQGVDCEVQEGEEDFVCCIHVYLCLGNNPEYCANSDPGGQIGESQCNYRNCRTVYGQ